MGLEQLNIAKSNQMIAENIPKLSETKTSCIWTQWHGL